MRLDEVQLAIRPRTILECLDLAFRVWGRHFPGLALAALIGVAPVVWAQLWWLENFQEDSIFFYFWAIVAAPWVTMPIMIFLGQITFSRRFSLRQATRTALGAFPSFLLYQGVLRILCVFIAILLPMVFIGMYYLSPILLLERPSLGRAWSRRTSMNGRDLGRVISLWITDLVILIAGTYGLGNFLRGLSSLWNDRFETSEFLSGGRVLLDFVDWENLVAFWLVISFLAVFRFITYLDCRIRHEGWDIELKLRAEAAHFPNREVA